VRFETASRNLPLDNEKGISVDIQDALTVVSISVSVAGIAIAASQIRVRRARLADVAPLLIGAFLIAAVAQVARMVI